MAAKYWLTKGSKALQLLPDHTKSSINHPALAKR